MFKDVTPTIRFLPRGTRRAAAAGARAGPLPIRAGVQSLQMEIARCIAAAAVRIGSLTSKMKFDPPLERIVFER